MLTTNPQITYLSLKSFTPRFPFFPNLSDSHIFLSSSLPSAHPFLKISIDPFPSEVQCPFSALPSFISRFLGSLVSFAYTDWILAMKCVAAKGSIAYSCCERSAVLATNRFVQEMMEKSFSCCFQCVWWLMFALAWMRVVARTRIVLTLHIGHVSEYVSRAWSGSQLDQQTLMFCSLEFWLNL